MLQSPGSPSHPLPHRLGQQQKEPGRSQVMEERKKKKAAYHLHQYAYVIIPPRALGQTGSPLKGQREGAE